MFLSLIKLIISVGSLVGAVLFLYPYLQEKSSFAEPSVTTNVLQEGVATTSSAKGTTTPKTTATKAPPKVPIQTNENAAPKLPTTEKTVVAPGPLRAAMPVRTETVLSVQGVIDLTNSARAQNGGLPPLAENKILDLDAQMKLTDMLTKQYFEHVSPSGVGPADLANTVGYAYVIVGENLALGDFGTDANLVDAWMASPGHRANILNAHYQEIGVAVGKGIYEGRETWLAVQSFGMPLSACPTIDPVKKGEIDTNNARVSSMNADLAARKAQIDATNPYDPLYNRYVNEYNALLAEVKVLAEANRVLVTEYNTLVQAFNSCVSNASGH